MGAVDRRERDLRARRLPRSAQRRVPDLLPALAPLDGGATFLDEARIASDPRFANAARPTIDVRGRDVALAWFGFTEFEADVYVARSTDDGASWSPFTDLTGSAPGAARIPHVAAAADGAAHVVWYDTRPSDAGGPRIELFHARVPGE